MDRNDRLDWNPVREKDYPTTGTAVTRKSRIDFQAGYVCNIDVLLAKEVGGCPVVDTLLVAPFTGVCICSEHLSLSTTFPQQERTPSVHIRIQIKKAN